MGCEQWREVLSAQLDGEETPAERAAADSHLASCGACRTWFDQAAAITRRARLSVSVIGPDLTDAVLAALPVTTPAAAPTGLTTRPPWRQRLVIALRAALGLTGALQVTLGLTQVGQAAAGPHIHAGGPLASGHLWHEAAAWNIAVGAGFLFVAARRTPPTGLLPMLSAFVGTLVLLSVNDLMTGRVETARLVSHGFLFVGYAIVVAMSRPGLHPGGPPTDLRPDRPRWRIPAEDEPPPPGLRLVPPPLPGSACHRDNAAA
ncbi:zf-HC2 domain-containing protein [Salinispora oceanensis]|uniref:zf-HC2 domain-containing protein n=1 Tax=Salinispora oceanensis TaxID=1050199 RepID=UPI00036EA1CD|nr:zf-HC2 domain-containing protein [Salinispora oceanensis]